MEFKITPDGVTHVSFHKSEEFQTTPQITQEAESTTITLACGPTLYRIETSETMLAQDLESFAAACRANIEARKELPKK